MNTIPFKVNKNIIQKIGGYSIASSENNYTKFDFQFSDDWNKVGIQVSATMFFDSDKIPDPVLLTMRNDNTGYCYLPSALKDEHGILKLGLTGAYVDDKNEKIVINTLLTSMPIGPGAFMTKYPANDIYKDMLARIASFDKSKQDRLICKNGITIDKDSNISVDDDYVITTGNITTYVDPIKKEIEQLEKNKLNGMTIRCTDLSELLNYEPGIYLALLNCAGFYESSQLEECEVLIDEYGITIYIVQAGLFYFITKEQISNGEMPIRLNLNKDEIEKALSTKANIVKNYNLIDFDEWFSKINNYNTSQIKVIETNKKSAFIKFCSKNIGSSYVSIRATGLIEVKPSTTYSLVFDIDNSYKFCYNIFGYVNETECVSTLSGDTINGLNNNKYTTGSNIKFISISFSIKGESYLTKNVKNIALYEGEDAKPFFMTNDIDIYDLVINKADKTDVDNAVDEINASLAKKADKTDVDNTVDEINTKLETKENVSNKVSEITHPSLYYYPDTKAVFDYVNSKLETPLADIESLKADKLDKADFNSYKTSNDNAVNSKVDTTDFNTYKTATDKAVKDNADNIKLLDTNKANVIISNTKDKATSNVLTDSSSHNIKNLSLYGNSAQSAVPTPTAPANIDNVTNPQIKLYHKNLFDFSVCTINANSSATTNSFDRDNCTINFTTSEASVNSGIYLLHENLNQYYKGYGVDYTKLNGKSVTLSFDVQSDIECKLKVQFTRSSYTSVNISSTKQRFSVTEVVDMSKLSKAICFYSNNVEATVTISNIQIEVGSIATDYEVCDVNKVSADCTLCKVNNIVDTLTVNSDGTGCITQNLLYERIKSGRSQSGHIWRYSTTSKRFYRDDNRYKTNYGTPNLLCSHFEVKDNERDVTLDNSIGFTSWTGEGVAIRMLQFDGDISAFENWLDNNEVYILIPLKQQIINELSKDQVDKILSLHTYYPSTTVISDCDCQIEYVADTKNYIDNKFNELSTAIVAHESEVM